MITIKKYYIMDDMKEYIDSILSMQESNGVKYLKRRTLVDLTKEWRRWIIDNEALFYASVPNLTYGFVRAQEEKRDDDGHLIGIVGMMIPKEGTISNNGEVTWLPTVYPIRHCYLTRQLIRMYKRFIGARNNMDKKEKEEIDLAMKKIETWLGDTSFLDLP